MSKAIVVYFSASGVTKEVAEIVAKTIKADIFELVPEVPYTHADLNWMDSKSRSSIEMKDPNSRPKYVGNIDNFDQYDTVLVGYPIWWYVEPRIITTFFESYSFKGKKLIPFATSGSSPINVTYKSIKEHCPEATFIEGKRLTRSNAQDWAKELVSKGII